MATGWDDFNPAPIEVFHSQIGDRFHEVADENHKIGGIQFNNLIAEFKLKICKEYNISMDPIPKGAS